MNLHRVGRRRFAVDLWRHLARKGFVLLGLFGALAVARTGAEPADRPAPELKLTLDDYLRLVLEHNQAVQAQMLAAEASRRKARAATGIFEPDLALSATRERNKRLNNSLQQAEAGGLLLFSEKNDIYDAGLETLIPSGGKIRLGYTLSDLSNNLTNSISIFNVANGSMSEQYQTFAGFTFDQPLLKNAGPKVTLAGIRLAALDSDIAFQEYRRQLMLTVSQAEAAYWNLYFAQEQLRFLDQSVAVAKSILDDARQRLKVGQASELDVLEAESGLALRQTKRNEARQSFYDALGQMRALYGQAPSVNAPTIRAVDKPSETAAALSYPDSFQDAFELNPEYLIQERKVRQEKLRLGVAWNQVLPELDFKAAYGYNGLGRSPGDSWNTVESQDYPSWSLGLELNIPLAGNIKGRNELSATHLSLRQAIVNLDSLQTQIANALSTAIQKARTWRESIGNYHTVVRFNESLLNTELARLKVGKVEPRKVLEVEADLFNARQSLADALVQYQRTLLELQLAAGTVLRNQKLDVTRQELHDETMALLERHRFPGQIYQPTLGVPDAASAGVYQPVLDTPSARH